MQHYKDPVTGKHTNNKEGKWGRLKQDIPQRVRNKGRLGGFLLIEVWRQHNLDNLWEELLKSLAETRYLEPGDKGYKYIVDKEDEKDKNLNKESKSNNNDNDTVTDDKYMLARTAIGDITNIQVQDV